MNRVYLPQPGDTGAPALKMSEASGSVLAVEQGSDLDVSLRLDLARILVKFGLIRAYYHVAVTNRGAIFPDRKTNRRLDLDVPLQEDYTRVLRPVLDAKGRE